jgi:hypothetical protein
LAQSRRWLFQHDRHHLQTPWQAPAQLADDIQRLDRREQCVFHERRHAPTRDNSGTHAPLCLTSHRSVHCSVVLAAKISEGATIAYSDVQVMPIEPGRDTICSCDQAEIGALRDEGEMPRPSLFKYRTPSNSSGRIEVACGIKTARCSARLEHQGLIDKREHVK